MTNTQIETLPESAVLPDRNRYDNGPWHGFRARTGAFVAALAIGTLGGWAGHMRGEALSHQQRAEALAGSVQARDTHEFGIAVDTGVAGVFSFLGAEFLISLGLVTKQQRYQLDHPEQFSDSPARSV